MPIHDAFIIIKGEPKALQIERISSEPNGTYAVKFHGNYRTYHYRSSDVTIVSKMKQLDAEHCRVYAGSSRLRGVTGITAFSRLFATHYRISFQDGHEKDYLHGSLTVEQSCLADKAARQAFDYLKRVAELNCLPSEEGGAALLSLYYSEIDFIEQSLVAACYLNAKKYGTDSSKLPKLIFPFGCNSSQEKAVSRAFENQISVVQGPPGTGKTQTILNIIANILMQGKTAIVVSNSNSATDNVLEKMKRLGLDFLVAPLGKRDNITHFIENQPALPQDISSWQCSKEETEQLRKQAMGLLADLRELYRLQEELAQARQELHDIEVEHQHFLQTKGNNSSLFTPKGNIHSSTVMELWLRLQAREEGEPTVRLGWLAQLRENLRNLWLRFILKHKLGMSKGFDIGDPQPVIEALQHLYYDTRIKELTSTIQHNEHQLSRLDADKLTTDMTKLSLKLLHGALYDHFTSHPRLGSFSIRDLKTNVEELCQQYPIVLSTTFSATRSLPNHVYDYIIMDEASQVSIDTGALALTCARSAVIVGDTLQLPNVVTDDDRLKLSQLFNEYSLPEGFDCSRYSFLQSVCRVVPGVKQTLLREHYRCHPKIINFCNQRFYGGQLIIMTHDDNDSQTMLAFKTVQGNHSRGHYNQREIDVVRQEVLPSLDDTSDIGIITPYNKQVEAFQQQLPHIETATVHKYQGREKDTIIMSVVDDQISDFSDDANLLNVAVSRAKKRFCIVTSGNDQPLHGNIAELIEYINYNNFQVVESNVCSVFDYLYSHYAAARKDFLARHRHISQYDSENLTFSLIETILSEHQEFRHIGVVCHTPLRSIFQNLTLLSGDERNYVMRRGSHVDFLLINHVTKKPVMGIETDGYNFHNEATAQHQRDIMKDHIFALYQLPLLRLSTTGSGEREKIVSALTQLV